MTEQMLYAVQWDGKRWWAYTDSPPAAYWSVSGATRGAVTLDDLLKEVEK